jgi:spore maturation protein CgeB
MRICVNDRLSLAETKNGRCTLRVTGEDGSVKTVHSLYDPEAEAKAIVNDFHYNGKGILVVLGLGLGYHVAELVNRFPDAGIIVVEADPGIYELAKGNGFTVEDKTKLIIGSSPEAALKEISGYQTKDGLKPVSIFSLSSVVSAFPSYYQPLLLSLKKTVSVRLWDRLKYPKFRGNTNKVLLIDSGYFLIKEVEKALTFLDHEVTKVPVKKGDKGEVLLSSLIDAVLHFRPDFILTINHLGFDEDGVLTSFFRSIEMPVASWYVDSPRLIIKEFEKNVSPYVSIFLWDREHTAQIKNAGFDAVTYLPLGTDTEIFKPMKKIRSQESAVSRKGKKVRPMDRTCDVGFVGNSLYDSARERLEKVPESFHLLVEEIACRLSSVRASLADVIKDTEADTLKKLTPPQRLDLEAAVLWKATLLYRLSCVKELEQFNVRIHGDNGWNQILGRQDNIKPPLNYYKELPVFYNTCRINFNATHLQMKEAVNQRVFDVPACGAFLLTDYQKSIDELFDAGREIVTFRDTQEIPGLVKYYLNNPGERETVSRRGMERVLKQHTYKHRLSKLIDVMKEKYS